MCLPTDLPAPEHRGRACSHPQNLTLRLAGSRRSGFSGGTEWGQRHSDLSHCQQAALELVGMISSEMLEVKEISHLPERASQACEGAPAAAAQAEGLGGGTAGPLAPQQAGIPHSLSRGPPRCRSRKRPPTSRLCPAEWLRGASFCKHFTPPEIVNPERCCRRGFPVSGSYRLFMGP